MKLKFAMINVVSICLVALSLLYVPQAYCETPKDYAGFYNCASQLDKNYPDGQDVWPLALSYYLKAFCLNPRRAEPLFRIAQHYYSTGDNSLAYFFCVMHVSYLALMKLI